MNRRKKKLRFLIGIYAAVCLFIVGIGPAAAAQLPSVSAQGYCVIDASTGEVIVGSREQDTFAPASITKIMTALVTVENCADLDTTVITTESALTELEPLSSTMSPMPRPGEPFTVRSLLYGLIMRSGNECANLLAEYVAGGTEAFAELMNERAVQAGALNTHFVNAHGLDDDAHYTTPYDMALIMKAALENPVTAQLLSDQSFTIPATAYAGERVMTSGHSMVNGTVSCDGVFAGKTGYTIQAKWTLATAARRDGRTLIAVVMQCDEGCNYSDTQVLFDFAFQKVQGADPSGGSQIYDPQLVAYDSSGFTVTWKVGPDAYMAEFPVWIEADSTDQMTKDTAVVSGDTLSYRVKLADHGGRTGAYTVQAYVYDRTGASHVSSVKILAGVEDLRPGLLQWDGSWYYVRENGTLALNWLETKDGCYYFDYTTGRMQTGWLDTGSTVFYLEEDGRMVSGWKEIDGSTYYFQVPGDMVTGVMRIGGRLYLFDANGALQTSILPAAMGEKIMNSIVPEPTEASAGE